MTGVKQSQLLVWLDLDWSLTIFRHGISGISFDGAESCDLCGLYLLSKLKHLNITGGLYRDDGLAISNLTARETENTKKAICEAFKQYNLSITIEANLKVVNFLDVQLDLENGLYKPYIKPNEKPNYVHSQSNHPPGTIKNIPVSINKRLSNISANKEIFYHLPSWTWH